MDQIRLAKLTLYGPRNKKDIDLLLAVQRGYVKLPSVEEAKAICHTMSKRT